MNTPKVSTPFPANPTVYPTPYPRPDAGQERPSGKFSRQDVANARRLREHCQRLALNLFFREDEPVRSLGFTSALGGEGKSFLSIVMAHVLAHDSVDPVTLIECNWEHPTFHKYFGIPANPGLAEWLRGVAKEDQIHYHVGDNLTVIPAGDSMQEEVKLLMALQRQGFPKRAARASELFVIDLPSVLTSGYGVLAAELLESVLMVVRTQTVADSMVVEACSQLKDAPVQGIILNQDSTALPRWIRQLL